MRSFGISKQNHKIPKELNKYATFKLRFYPGPILLQFLADLEKIHQDC